MKTKWLKQHKYVFENVIDSKRLMHFQWASWNPVSQINRAMIQAKIYWKKSEGYSATQIYLFVFIPDFWKDIKMSKHQGNIYSTNSNNPCVHHSLLLLHLWSLYTVVYSILALVPSLVCSCVLCYLLNVRIRV